MTSIETAPKKTRGRKRQDTSAEDAILAEMAKREFANYTLINDNCFAALDAINARYPRGLFDVIFADPPYFLSNGGISCHAGKMVKVDKGSWDKSQGPELNHEFNFEWLRRCQAALKPNGTIWVSGTHHVIFSVGYAMQQLGMKVLNQITWQKPNPPPNLACRYFTHSTETIIWAAKTEKSKHVFHYKEMRRQNNMKQMKDVWSMTAPKKGEKLHGRHPTQKPVELLRRILEASSNPGDLVLDPFMGSGTTGVACRNMGRRFVGVELDDKYIRLADKRIISAELEQTPNAAGGAEKLTTAELQLELK